MDDYVYDVALSFAGADREPARIIAAVARANDLHVFLDEHHYAESWGRNLNEYLADVYARSSRYCVVLISREYCEAAYTNLERRHALDRALTSGREYILPVRLDDSWLDGLPTSTAYLDLRSINATEVGAALVRKIRGSDGAVAVPAYVPGPVVRPVDDPPGASSLDGSQPFSFAGIRIADECRGWRESTDPIGYGSRDNFRPLPDETDSLELHCTIGYVEDPILDITVMNRTAGPVVLTAVGVVFVRGCISGFGGFGGGTGEPIPLHRTYELPLPDLWSVLAHAHRDRDADTIERVDVDEVAMCRLPDPILLQRDQPYRYGLRLFDFMNYCPTTVEMRLWARTDLGDVRSRQLRLRYYPGGSIPPMERYRWIRDPEGERHRADQRARDPDHERWEQWESRWRRERHEQLAYRLWEEAGRREGHGDLYWHRAGLDMLGVHRRPLPTSGE
jgi:hypothetical protein